MKHMGRQANRPTASLVFQLVLIDTMTPLIVGQRNQLGQGDSQLGYTPSARTMRPATRSGFVWERLMPRRESASSVVTATYRIPDLLLL
jgi:hypothetical protein